MATERLLNPVPGTIGQMPSSAHTRALPATAAASDLPAWVVGPQWSQLRFRQPGWLILPLRMFLAGTFVFAGLQKLANPAYLDPNNPSSVVGQMRQLRHVSPIGPMLSLSLHAPTAVGLMIAFGELAVGVGVLLGVWTRLAALGGMALSLTFLLTVSWTTSPYYYGSDIVFFFAWTAIVGFGASGVLSIDAWLQHRTRAASGLQPDADHRSALGRRVVLITGVATLATGAAAAWLGRLAGGTSTARPSALGTSGRQGADTPPSTTPSSPAGGTGRPPPGTAIGRTSQVPVGQAGRFTDPANGHPAYVVHTAGSDFVAFSAVCTHAGCTVQFDAGNMQFTCPCHGGVYDARTGRVLAGPPPSPLPTIPVHVANGEIRVD